MTVQDTGNKFDIIGDGVTTIFPWSNIKIINNSDMTVYINDVLLTEGIDYTLLYDADTESGTVTFFVAPTLTGIGIRAMPLTQPFDIPLDSDFDAEKIETMSDNIVLIVQDQQDDLNRSLKAPANFVGDFESEVVASGNIVVGNSTATGFADSGVDVSTFNQDVTDTAANAEAALASADAAALSEVATAADVVTTNADVVTTNADALATDADATQTALDAIATAADRVQTGLDVTATNADVVTTNADVVTTNADAVQTALDAVATAADRVQTGVDASDASDSADAAALSASLVPLANYLAITDPTVNDDSDDGYSDGSPWTNTSTNTYWVCTDATVGTAIWTELTAAAPDASETVKGIVELATNAEVLAGTDTARVPSVSTMIAHVGMIKISASFDNTGTFTVKSAIGCTLTDLGTGSTRVNHTTNFVSANQVTGADSGWVGVARPFVAGINGAILPTTSTTTFQTITGSSNAVQDADYNSLFVMGEQ